MVLLSGNSTENYFILTLQNGNRHWMTAVTYAFFIVFAPLLSLFLQYLSQTTKSRVSSGNNAFFLRFQRQYLTVYFLALMGDWLQGPYVYKLYSHYGFVESQIAVLYVVGFGASIVFGTGTGVLADRFGRKKMCITFSILYSLCCLMKLSPNYNVLMLGRLLGGISTSLLFSTFESWYVYEHIQTYDFPKEWISVTFSKATFWNGVLAIAAGVMANITSEWLQLGPVSPFLLAIPFLFLCGLIITRNWKENYGDKTITSSKACMQGLRLIIFNDKILLLGVVQSLFESVMYVFVFLWTPILEPSEPPLGMVFSVFMICIMIGSSIYQLLVPSRTAPQQILLVSVILSFLSMLTCSFSTSPEHPRIFLSFIAFLVLEVSVGMYFPAIGYLKSQIIPESHRANIMNWFRVPLNVITCGLLLWLHREDSDKGNCWIFSFCSLLMFIATVLVYKFRGSISLDPNDGNLYNPLREDGSPNTSI